MAFLERLERLGDRVTIWPEDEHGLLDLQRAVAETDPDAAIYCCGPEPLIAAVESLCKSISRAAPHVERFSARPGHAAEIEDALDTEFEIVLAKSGIRLTVPVGMTIIQVLDRARVFVPTSCTEGYCGTCETKVLSGIPDHRDDYLTAEVRASNQAMMVCISRSKTPELTLNL
jgi:ferredoxin